MPAKLLQFILPAALFLFSCEEKRSPVIKELKKDSTEIKNKKFFPVTAFILGELLQIDSLPVTPLKIVTVNGKADSIWMKKKDIRIFAEPFLHPVIDTANLKNLFTENSFLDQTINAFTFSYDAISYLPDTMQLKRWDVYIDPQKGTVKRIYMVKEINEKDNAAIKQTMQLTWVTARWCKITIITEQGNNQPDVKEEKMIWDFNEP